MHRGLRIVAVGLVLGPPASCAELNPDFDDPLATTAGSSVGPATDTGATPVSATSADGSGSGSHSGSDSGSDSGPDSDSGSDSGDPGTGDPADASLKTLRVDRPCMDGKCPFNTDFVCANPPVVTDSAPLVGPPDTVYDVTLHFRGVVEMADYGGGRLDGSIYVGGTEASGWDPYRLTISDPPMDYWLNPLGSGNFYTQPVDFMYVVPIATGATVELYTDSGGDSCGLFNEGQSGEPVVIPGVDPAPDPFSGQFMQVDALAFVAQG